MVDAFGCLGPDWPGGFRELEEDGEMEKYKEDVRTIVCEVCGSVTEPEAEEWACEHQTHDDGTCCLRYVEHLCNSSATSERGDFLKRIKENPE